MTGPSVPPPPPSMPPAGPPPAPPASTAPAAPRPSAMAGAEHEMAAVEAKAAAAMGGMSGPETLIIGGAALFLIIGEILLGAIFGGSGVAVALGIGGISLGGVLAGEALFFVWLGRAKAGRAGVISAGATQAIVGALVVAVVIFELGELIAVIRNITGFFNLGFVSILVVLCRIVGAAAMGLGVVSWWSPMGSTTPAAPRPKA